MKKPKRKKSNGAKSPGGRQREIPGTEGKRYPKLDERAVQALDAARGFTLAGKRRAEAFDLLRAEMIRLELEHYVTADRLVCTRKPKAESLTVEPMDEVVR